MVSATRESYFGHEWCFRKQVQDGKLGRFSTFPKRLLLLLVL